MVMRRRRALDVEWSPFGAASVALVPEVLQSPGGSCDNRKFRLHQRKSSGSPPAFREPPPRSVVVGVAGGGGRADR